MVHFIFMSINRFEFANLVEILVGIIYCYESTMMYLTISVLLKFDNNLYVIVTPIILRNKSDLAKLGFSRTNIGH